VLQYFPEKGDIRLGIKRISFLKLTTRKESRDEEYKRAISDVRDVADWFFFVLLHGKD
jgi:hypothetical protein